MFPPWRNVKPHEILIPPPLLKPTTEKAYVWVGGGVSFSFHNK